ncbi:MAG: 4-(cytidine 5'-diphospho)-2-C-methyl-D-erythritol kinase [Rikenellaceae bacterium]|nr:4-(cytidine 5'-diphospho)-2-C-methyl-D-erythritol kinase [Rikenellaceae bacterium]MCL2692319.1 4-(cytidine 5'-diphospho)-2-C-methyl-D-erythritol kinase [Rikenellaceae bacterium]
MIFYPNCKINIGLDVLGRRADGYHDIVTLMIPVAGLCDILEIVPAAESRFTQSGIDAGAPEQNLCVRAYNLMRERFGIPAAAIHLHKIIPPAAGLGGGSSDAAFTIRGLDKIFSLDLSVEEMERLAAELGSDVPFFIRNTPQLAVGRGEILTPFDPQLAGKKVVIIVPSVRVSTAEAYAGVAVREPAAPLAERLASGVGAWRNNGVENAFEPSIFARYPLLARIKESLYAAGALYASMSGSGSAVYGIFESGVNAAVCGAGEAEVFTCEF